MKRATATLSIAGLLLVLLVAGLYLFVVRPRLGPIEVGPPVTAPPVPPSGGEEERNGALNLYFHAPLRLAGIARIEMTVTGIDAVGGDGTRYTVFEGTRRLTVQQDVVQKIASEPVMDGRLDRIVLTFAPTARITSADGTTQIVALPRREFAIPVEEDIPQGRTMNVLVPLPKSTAFGEQDGVLTLRFPASTEATHALLGGYLPDPRSVGKVFSIPEATLRDVLLADVGLDIAPREGPRGSTGFGSPDEAPPSP